MEKGKAFNLTWLVCICPCKPAYPGRALHDKL